MNEVEQLKAQIAELQKQNAAIKGNLKCKITEKGNLSVSGIKPGWPLTFEPGVWRAIFANREKIEAFLDSPPKTDGE